MLDPISTQKRIARIAGGLYLALAITGTYAMMYVHSQIVVREDNAATVNNIVNKEQLFRSGVALHLISVTCFLFLALTLYRLLKPVNLFLGRQMVVLVVVQVPIIFLLEICRIAPVFIINGSVSKSMSVEQIHELSGLFLGIHTIGIQFVEMFWGLWLIPFGLLVIRSRFMPRLLGILLVAAGIGYTIDSLVYILVPSIREFTRIPALVLSGLGEISTIIWLLVWGVKSHLSIGVVSEKAS